MINIPLNDFSISPHDPIIQVRDFDDEDQEEAESKTSVLLPSTPTHTASNSRAVQAWKDLLKLHPWSVSDPGPASLLILDVRDRKYSASSPLLKGGVPPQHKPHPDQQGDYLQPLLETGHNNEELTGCFGTPTRAILPKKLRHKAFLRWVFIVLNVVFEVCQAALAQEAAHLGRRFYLKLSVITSSVCLMMSLVEAFHEGRSKGVVWQKRGHCCWFYYPGTQGRLFGRFSLYFGIICSMIQLVLNVIEKLTRKALIKFDIVPLLLSVCYLVAAMVASPEQKDGSLAIVKCKTHGYNAAEATSIIDGHKSSSVFECPECQLENIS